MAGTRKARVPMAEQIKLINECRQSGMEDAEWGLVNNIPGSPVSKLGHRVQK